MTNEPSSIPSTQSQIQPATQVADNEESIRESIDLELEEHSSSPQEEQHHVQHTISDPPTVQNELSEPMHAASTPQRNAGRPCGPSRKTLRKQQLVNFNKVRSVHQGGASATEEQDECHIEEEEYPPSLRRSERVRTTRAHYDAHTGQ